MESLRKLTVPSAAEILKPRTDANTRFGVADLHSTANAFVVEPFVSCAWKIGDQKITSDANSTRERCD